MRYIITMYLVFFSIYLSAQVPQRMSYQAVIRNANNTLLSQQNIGVRISILQADTAGQPVYIETHYTKTNINGLMTLQIGGGLKFFGDFSSINWSTGHYFVKFETDPDGGFDYRITGYSELLSVPYALFSGGQTDTFNLNKKINTKLSIGDTALMLIPYAKKGNFITKSDLDSTNNFDINLKGSISASKNVTVKGNIEALGTTSTIGTIEKPFKGLFLSAGSLSIASDTLGKNVPATVFSNVEGNLQISAGGMKLMGANTSFIAPKFIGELTGNAATATYATSAGTASTATKLATARNINGVAFDGSSDISITAIADAGTLSGTTLNATITNSSLTSIGTLTSGSVPYSLLSGTIPIWNQSTTGNAATATYATSAGTLSGTLPYTSLSGTIPTWNQSTTGNAATATYATSAGTASTATKLATARNINGVAFDGTIDITIATTSPNSLTYNNSGTGDISGGTYDGSSAKTISYNSIGASPLSGSTSLSSVGTITTGIWSATTIDIAHGGTNTNSIPSAGAIVYGNGTAYAMSAVGVNGQYLQSTGSNTPIWSQPGPASIQVLTTSGTYITPVGVKVIIIELVGGGGGSGAIAAANGNNNGTVSGGGGSGAYTRAIILNPQSSYSFTIGSGGTASAIGVAGGNGGATSFNAGAITAPGGSGGAAGSALANGTVSLGGAGGLAGVGGSFMVPGHSGGTGFSGSVISVAGAGASSYFGDGGVAPAVIDGISRAGVAATGYGAGASGAAAVNVGTGAIGAAGFHGVIVVTEYK